jgi:hypothetical protein
VHSGLCDLFEWLDFGYSLAKDRQSQAYADELHERWHAVADKLMQLPREDALAHVDQVLTQVFLLLKEIVTEAEDATR